MGDSIVCGRFCLVRGARGGLVDSPVVGAPILFVIRHLIGSRPPVSIPLPVGAPLRSLVTSFLRQHDLLTGLGFANGPRNRSLLNSG